MWVGDDVVDLDDPETRAGAQHPGFAARVFGADELHWLGAQADPRKARWLLWAAKESALKLARKLDAATVFSPREFRVEVETAQLARVRHFGLELQVQLTGGATWLHALAAQPSGARIDAAALEELNGCAGEGPSTLVRRFACTRLARPLGCEPGELAVTKTDGIPQLLRAGVAVAADLSLSHHGRYVSFACALHDAGCAGDARLLSGVARIA